MMKKKFPKYIGHVFVQMSSNHDLEITQLKENYVQGPF